MNIYEAVKKALAENKCIALPDIAKASETEYQLILKPFLNNMKCIEYYGNSLQNPDQFSLAAKELIREDWKLI